MNRAESVQGKAITILFFIAMYCLLAGGIYWSLTQHVSGANDFFSRWKGAQALLFRGENPYADQVTREIQLEMYGRLALLEEDQVAFAYPLYTAFAIFPLTVLPYSQVQALWMAGLIVAVIGGTFALLRVYAVPIRPLTLGLVLLGVMIFYPTARGVFLGQFALVSFSLLALALLAVQSKQDVAAGILLGFSMVKPQPAILLVLVIVVWAFAHDRRKIAMTTIATLVTLIVAGLSIVSTWLFDFLNAVFRYSEYQRVGAPAQTLAEWLVPSAWFPLTLIIIFVLIVWLARTVVSTLNQSWDNFQSMIGLTALVTTWIAGRVGTPDQILLLMPWLFWLSLWLRAKHYALALIAAIIVLFVPWQIFAATLVGNAEHVSVTLVLPGLTLITCAAWQLALKRSLRNA